MRNLTLGVLIVTGGTLAALPFRRYHIQTDGPIQATGPSQSALDADANRGLASERDSETAVGSPQLLTESLPPWRQTVTPPPTRRIDIPLSFEDLLIPIDHPGPISDRFNATADVRAKQLQRERAVAMEMPPMESLAVTLQEELRNKIHASQTRSMDQPDTDQGAPSLARAAAHPTPQRLPKPDIEHSDRHWIRQP